jgi:hypothetical protein
MFNYPTVKTASLTKYETTRNSVTTCSSHTPLEEAQAMFVETLGWQDAGETIR